MNRKLCALVLFFSLLIGSSVGYGAVSDYLGTSKSEVSPTTSARIDQPVTAVMVLENIGVVPEEARLNISTELTSPEFIIDIDNETTRRGLSEFPLDLPSDGVKEITIRVSGYAPEVDRLTVIDVLNVNTYVKYKSEDGIYQDDGRLTLEISNVEIQETKREIYTAESKLTEAEGIVDSLKSQGVNTVSLESQIQTAKGLIDNANELHDRGQADLSKSTATSASAILDQVISDAGSLGKKETTEGNVKKYVTIAGAVILVILVVLFMKSRREELG
jgi:hypothetical protein